MIKQMTAIVLVLLLPLVSYAGIPMDTVKTGVNKVLSVAGDPTLKGDAAKQAKEEKIRAILGEFFDFTVLSRLTLGKNWKKFKPDQQKEFIGLYRTLLENVYLGRILEYSDEKVVFTVVQKESRGADKNPCPIGRDPDQLPDGIKKR